MNQQTNHFGRFLLSATVACASLPACKREAAIPSLQIDPPKQEISLAQSNEPQANGNAPASHIAASEKLTIPATVAIPENAPAGNARVATFYAVGVQKYKAREKAGSPGTYEWAFVAPQADLYNADNDFAGTHSAGPNWQISPSDFIFAQQFSPARTAPSEDPESIDWLLLQPKQGTTPTGLFKDVDYVQRIATKGGKAPLTPPSNPDETIEVKYQAVYRFSKINE